MSRTQTQTKIPHSIVNKVFYTNERLDSVPVTSVMTLESGERATFWRTMDGKVHALAISLKNYLKFLEMSREIIPFLDVQGRKWNIAKPNVDLVLRFLAAIDISKMKVIDLAEVPKRFVHLSKVWFLVAKQNWYKTIVTWNRKVEGTRTFAYDVYTEARAFYYVVIVLEDPKAKATATYLVFPVEKVEPKEMLAIRFGEAPSHGRSNKVYLALGTPKTWYEITGLLEVSK